MKHLNTMLIALFACTGSWCCASESPHHDFVVARDGTGDFLTVQEAFDAVPDFRKKHTVIFVKDGVYKEKLVLPASKNGVVLIGQSVEKTILTNDDYAQKKNRFGEDMGTTGSSGFFLFGNDFTARHITFENGAGPVGQAVAVRVDGDRVFFDHCRFLGHQDTLYSHGINSRQYYRQCTIEGTVDFIFGSSTAVFDRCEIVCRSGGYVTAASTQEGTAFGFVFFNCRITGSAEPGSVYLGRPWRPYARTVLIDCELGDIIRPEGWHNWGRTSNESTAFYAEYRNTGPGAQPDHRVPWSGQLTDDQRKTYTLDNIFKDWNPLVDE